MIDTKTCFFNGGHCTPLQVFVGSMHKIHPIIHIRRDCSLGILDVDFIDV
jgi:hypothetical protein